MVQQKVLDLNKPLPVSSETTISRIPLEPALATAALTLHGDYYRQLQSKCNASIVWHPFTLFYVVSIFAAYTAYVYTDLYHLSRSVPEFVQMALRHKYLLTKYFPVLIFLSGTVGIVAFTITDEFRTISDNLGSEAGMGSLFQFALKIYAASGPADASSDFVKNASASTDFIEYRQSPIGVVTVVPVPDRCTDDTFYAKISGLNVRKAYRKAGVEADLLTFAKEKALDLAARHAQEHNVKSRALEVVLLADSYSVDEARTDLYKASGFDEVEVSYDVNPFCETKDTMLFKVVSTRAALKFFGISRSTYQIKLGDAPQVETAPAQKSQVRRRKI